MLVLGDGGGRGAAAAAAATCTSALVVATAAYWWHGRVADRLVAQAEDRRREERTGRIRAEVKLRTLWKEKVALEMKLLSSAEEEKGPNSSSQQQHIDNDDRKSSNRNNSSDHKMLLQCIGTVVSPYTKRMGTPRQGSLVPSSRAFVELNVPTEALDGIESYSHIWIIFGFHANTNNGSHNNNTKKTKVRPPRATGNQKVGQLATRSPHRPNPLGLSLVKMETLDTELKRLHISGLDLVNGTPVYDIKPCVPWDIPGYNHNNDEPSSSLLQHGLSSLRVPDWVGQKDDVLETVRFTKKAQASFRRLVAEEGRLAPLYTVENDGVAAAEATLMQVLAQDPRSSHKGLKVNQRGTSSSSPAAAAAVGSRHATSGGKKSSNNSNNHKNGNNLYSLVFGQTLVEFQVLPWGVQVENVTAVDFDDDAYVEGIPLISEQNQRRK